MDDKARIAGVCGIIFFLLSLVIAVVAPPFPILTAAPLEVTGYYAAHGLPFLLGNYIAVVALLPSLPPIAYLTLLIKRAEGEAGWLWMMVFGAALVSAAVGSVDLFVFQGVAVAAAPGNEAVAKALSDLANMGFGFYLVTQCAFGAVAAAAILATDVLPRWLAYTSLLVAALSLAGSLGTVVTAGPLAAGGIVTLVAFAAMLGWWLALSIVFLARAGAQPSR